MDRKPQSDRAAERDERLRGRGLAAREDALGAREVGMDARETGMDARESASGTRESSLAEREEIARLRDEAQRAQQEAREAAASRDRLIPQMREANEKLVLATLRADELAAEAHAARRAIAASEERFRTLVTTSAAIVFEASAAGRIHVDPGSWRAFTGLEVPGDKGDPAHEWAWLEALHPSERDQVREAWARAVATHTPYVQKHRLRRADGTYAWVAATAVPIPSEGPTREWIGTMSDISDAVRIDETREQFIAILGHDLRAPLSTIAMATQLLTHGALDARGSDLVVRIVRSTRRMEGMIGALLDFARGRLGGGIPIERARCDLASLCLSALEEAQQAQPTRVFEFETKGDVTGSWDADRLEQVLTNLLGNAVQHGEDPIRVVARGADDHVILTVQNRGRAIPTAVLPVLFEPFHERALGSRSGLGLGLYIVGEIVRAHGGTIGVRSSTEEGTTLTVELPRHPADVA